MAVNSDIQKVSYLCSECSQTRNLNIDRVVHLQRRELDVNGLASYIDVHAKKDGTDPHGSKLFIDKNFHVRTNNALKVKTAAKSPSAIPMPGMRTTNLTTKYGWSSWTGLELELKSESLKFLLEHEMDLDDEHIGHTIEITSELGSVVCTIEAVIPENAPEQKEYLAGWMQSFVNKMELASSLHRDLIPEVLRYLDHHVHRRITYLDQTIISILIDRSSILIPDKDTMRMIAKYGPAMSLIGLDPEKLSSIATKLCELDQFSMIDIQHILESELDRDSELEEEFVVLALFYLLSLDAFDYKLSYLQTQG
ncbi:MAG: hypothetical protein ACXAE3_06830 [Candidatus Kariarchaeaceae archaeon]